ncbi:zinc ribbon domain-containing protein [Aeromicrobium duanguangcaii]|uniref:C4-type zinc ribbon domain-containing protein n=1 Tax=Aeromicrobium duanguangcaii TaxID=2968086 RepID=A0ABY5KGR4_9ACTN|nr:C4-type zinc ribbon domain-containing protein [Aeromicrobium duanguangcaii]MCD9153377.1 C4-type zinc ribbon domain-containing protein [Aeromicrobium duanguangcaii]MCL3836637.1 C4-type zinc ribbon domain-containing protein [Aeromicrobium duanguangcaii]UUI69530.1 C4-type zinc ribbon domain-containing protein [Aeromicrobium duanguangcaii]
MKAEPVAQQALLDLQGKDSALAQLTHRRKSLPEHAEIAAADGRIRELDARRIEVQTRVSDLTRAAAKADTEVELVKTRRTRDEDRLSSGAITNPKDLSSLQSELEALARRIATLEDEELEIMEQLETAQAELSEAEAALAQENATREVLVAARDEKVATFDAEAAQLVAARKLVLPRVPADLLALYEKVAGSHSGLGAAELRARRCTGCHIEINGADLRELAAEPADTVLRCPECSRILVRTPESGV